MVTIVHEIMTMHPHNLHKQTMTKLHTLHMEWLEVSSLCVLLMYPCTHAPAA